MIIKKVKSSDKNKIFSLPSEGNFLIIHCDSQDDLDTYSNAWKWRMAYESVWDKIFRPRHKHLYSNTELNELIISENGCENSDVNRVMDILEEIYHEINRDF